MNHKRRPSIVTYNNNATREKKMFYDTYAKRNDGKRTYKEKEIKTLSELKSPDCFHHITWECFCLYQRCLCTYLFSAALLCVNFNFRCIKAQALVALFGSCFIYCSDYLHLWLWIILLNGRPWIYLVNIFTMDVNDTKIVLMTIK